MDIIIFILIIIFFIKSFRAIIDPRIDFSSGERKLRLKKIIRANWVIFKVNIEKKIIK